MKKLALFTMLATIASTGYAAVATEKVALDEKALASLEELISQEKLSTELKTADNIFEKVANSGQTKEQKNCLKEKKSECLKNDKTLKNGKVLKDNLRFKGQGLNCILAQAKKCKVDVDPNLEKAANSKVAILEII